MIGVLAIESDIESHVSIEGLSITAEVDHGVGLIGVLLSRLILEDFAEVNLGGVRGILIVDIGLGEFLGRIILEQVANCSPFRVVRLLVREVHAKPTGIIVTPVRSTSILKILASGTVVRVTKTLKVWLRDADVDLVNDIWLERRLFLRP